MWDNVLQLMTVVAVITNCALVGVTSTHLWAEDVSPATRILVVVIAEHVVLFMKVGGEAGSLDPDRWIRIAAWSWIQHQRTLIRLDSILG